MVCWILLRAVITVALLAVPGIDGIRDLPADLKQQIADQKDGVNAIIDYLLNGQGKGQAYRNLAQIVDLYGHRMVGSTTLNETIDKLMENLVNNGITQTWAEPFIVPNWVREDDSLTMLTPRVHQMDILALGTTVNGSAEGKVIVVRSFDELDQFEAENRTQGKIVVFNQPWVDYGVSSVYRSQGAWRAAKAGGVAALVRSLTGYSLNTPHTGGQTYHSKYPKVPVVSITVEDAELMQRLQDMGDMSEGTEVTVSLVVNSHPVEDTNTRNIFSNIPGTLYPEQLVMFSAHTDSWDVGAGAMDDGGGIAIGSQILTTVKALGLSTKRTLRFVGCSAEESGLLGAFDLCNKHSGEFGNMSLEMHSDGGTFSPHGVDFGGSGLARAIIEEIAEVYLGVINASVVTDEGGLSGICPAAKGVPALELKFENSPYFNYHHTKADTMTVEDPDELDRCSVVWTVIAYVVANLDDMLPREGDYPEGSVGGAPVSAASIWLVTTISVYVVSLNNFKWA